MLFNSLDFAIFLCVVFPLFLLSPVSLRWVVLLAGSYFFYGQWQPLYLLVLFFCTITAYSAGIWIERIDNRAPHGKDMPEVLLRKKKALLVSAVAANLGVLFFYKYFDFLRVSLNAALTAADISRQFQPLNILLPLGISFFSFQAVSYIMDIYSGKSRAERHPGIFALYLAFFPKIMSGPIERAGNLLPQLRTKLSFDPLLASSGIKLFIWGVFKKIVIADRLGLYVDMVFSRPQDYHGQTLILAAWFFTLQIYCDFSAYTDMAIGCSRLFGIELSRNFQLPYFARSIPEFWKRWHITLTSWFRDYLYIPLGGNRVSPAKWHINIMFVFVLSGLWHGANWTFLVWGGLHGFFYLFGRATARLRGELHRVLGLRGIWHHILQVIVTFNLAAIAWVFFRAATIQDGIYVVAHLFTSITEHFQWGASQFTTFMTICLTTIFVAAEVILYLVSIQKIKLPEKMPFAVLLPAYTIVLLVIFLFGVSSSKFIYFHF